MTLTLVMTDATFFNVEILVLGVLIFTFSSRVMGPRRRLVLYPYDFTVSTISALGSLRWQGSRGWGAGYGLPVRIIDSISLGSVFWI